MNRVIPLLLIPVVVFAQSAMIGHTHQNCDIAETASHAARPHIHLRGHQHGAHVHHHDHHRNDLSDAADSDSSHIRSATDHDADAIDVALLVTDGDSRPQVRQSLQGSDNCIESTNGMTAITSIPQNYRSQIEPPLIDPARPLFLRTHSLRC